MTAMEFQYNLISLHESLKRFATRLTADSKDAKDLVQDTFLKALKYREKYVNESNFQAWTFTIMKNTFINNYRRVLYNKNYIDFLRDDICIHSACTSGSSYPESAYSSKELGKAIDALHDDFKLPFRMHYEGFKYKEIAETLNLRLGTVKSRIFCTRKLLHKHLNR